MENFLLIKSKLEDEKNEDLYSLLIEQIIEIYKSHTKELNKAFLEMLLSFITSKIIKRRNIASTIFDKLIDLFFNKFNNNFYEFCENYIYIENKLNIMENFYKKSKVKPNFYKLNLDQIILNELNEIKYEEIIFLLNDKKNYLYSKNEKSFNSAGSAISQIGEELLIEKINKNFEKSRIDVDNLISDIKKEVKTRGRKPNKNKKEDMIKFLKQEDKNSFIAQSILNKIVDYTKILIFNQKWEIRHGASLILMNYTNKIFKFIHLNKLNHKLLEIKELNKKDIIENINYIKVSKINNFYINDYWVDSCIDLFKRSMLLLILDRFSDFLSDKSNTIVREISINTMSNILNILIDDELLKLTDSVTKYILEETIEKTGFQSKQSLFNLNSKILKNNKDLNISIINFNINNFNNHEEIIESSCEYLISIICFLNNNSKIETNNTNNFYLIKSEDELNSQLEKIERNKVLNLKNKELIISNLFEKKGEYYDYIKSKFNEYLLILVKIEEISFLPYTLFLLYQEILYQKKSYYLEFILKFKENLPELNKKYLFNINTLITNLFQKLFINLFSSKKYNVNYSEENYIKIFIFYFLSINCRNNIEKKFHINILIPLKTIYERLSNNSKNELITFLKDILESYQIENKITTLLNMNNSSIEEKIENIEKYKIFIVGNFLSFLQEFFINLNFNETTDFLSGILYSVLLKYDFNKDVSFLKYHENKLFLNSNNNLSIYDLLNKNKDLLYKSHPFFIFFESNILSIILEIFNRFFIDDSFKNCKILSDISFKILNNLNNNEFIDLKNLDEDLKNLYLTILKNENNYPQLKMKIFINFFNNIFKKKFESFIKKFDDWYTKTKTITSCLFIYYYNENNLTIERSNLNKLIIPLLTYIKNDYNNNFMNEIISKCFFKIIEDFIKINIKPCQKILDNLNLYYFNSINTYITNKVDNNKYIKIYNFHKPLLTLLFEKKYQFSFNVFNNIQFTAFYYDLINYIPNKEKILLEYIEFINFSKKNFSYIKLIKKIYLNFIQNNKDENIFYKILDILNDQLDTNSIEFSNFIYDLMNSKKKVELINLLKIFIFEIIKNLYNPKKEIRDSFMRLFSKIIILIHLRHKESENLFYNLNNNYDKRFKKGVKFVESFQNTKIKEKRIKLALNNNKKFILRNYQIEAVSWLYSLFKYNLSGLLCDEMGLGKTIQSLVTFKMLKEKFSKEKTLSLIIAPIILKHHWKSEIIEIGGLKCEILNKNTKNININVDFLICSYFEIKRFKEQFSKINFFMIIMDEIHLIKNPNTNMYKNVLELKSKLKLGLSGTPLQNNLIDLWSIFNIIMPNYLMTLPEFKLKYKKLFNLNLMNLDLEQMKLDSDQIGILEELHKKILPFIMRRTKSDVLKDLPDKVYNDIVLEMTETQKILYTKYKNNEIENKYETGYSSKDKDSNDIKNKSSSNFLKDLNIMRNICNHPGILVNSGLFKTEMINDSSSAKLNALFNLFNQLNYDDNTNINDVPKMVIFSHSAIFITLIYSLILKKFQHLFPLIFQSKLSSQEKFGIVNDFQNFSKHKILLLTPQAGGLGLNLTSANIVILMDHHFNPFIDMQAIDRTHRIGQKNIVYIYRFIMKDSFEEKVMGIQKLKKSMFNTIITDENKNLEDIKEKGNLYTNIEKNMEEVAHQSDQEDDWEMKVKDKISQLLKNSQLNKLWNEDDYNKHYS